LIAGSNRGASRSLPLAQRRQPRDRRRHRGLGGAGGAVAEFDRDAEAEFRKRRALDALRARFGEGPRAHPVAASESSIRAIRPKS
jgi:hypothetical protein